MGIIHGAATFARARESGTRAGFRLAGCVALAMRSRSSCSPHRPSPAAANFRLCNNTSSRVGVAIGYKDARGLDHGRLVEPAVTHL